MPTAITDDVLAVLREAVVTDEQLDLVGQLDPKLYARTKKVLTGLGWKWNPDRGTHRPTSPTARQKLTEALGGGTYVDPAKDESYWPTPPALAEYVALQSLVGELPDDAVVLEPSAGDGALIRAMYGAGYRGRVVALEPNADRAAAMRTAAWFQQVKLHTSTLEAYADQPDPGEYSAVLMNPPFTLPGQPNAWINHLDMAYDLLAPGGRLACIVPASFEFRDDVRHRMLRQWVKDLDGEWERLPDDAFKESGTGVRTVLILLTKPAAADPAPGPEPEADPEPEPPCRHESEKITGGECECGVVVADPDPDGPVLVAAAPPKMRSAMLPLAKIDRNPDQPRKLFDEAALDELAESIARLGLLQSIVVRPGADGRYIIVMGERRWRACQRVKGLTKVSCRVMETWDDAEAFIASVAENVNRVDMTLMEEARAYAGIVAANRTVEQVASLFGKTPAHVQWRIDLLALSDASAELVESGVLRAQLAWYVAQLTPGNQDFVVRRYMKGDFATERDAVAFARAVSAAEQQPAMFGDAADDAPAAVEQRTAARAARTATLDRVAKLTEALTELAGADPAELARVLGSQLATRARQLDEVCRIAGQARATMRAAVAHDAASTLFSTSSTSGADSAA